MIKVSRKKTLKFTLIDYFRSIMRRVQSVTVRLKDLEDKWILKMGTFYGDSGLNSRDEVQTKTRFNWMRN